MNANPRTLKSSATPPKPAEARRLVIGLAGQPNVGKSTVFSILTGLTAEVGNWPGRTVERREGSARIGGRLFHVVDLPGTYSMTSNSEEERIARDFILKERPDVIVMLADAAALERNLYLLAELLLLPIPVVLGVNMVDVARREGVEFDAHVLEAALGLPVVPMVASRNEGVAELLAAAADVADGNTAYAPDRPEIAPAHQQVYEQLHALIESSVPAGVPADWAALKLLEGDRELTERANDWLPPADLARAQELLHEHEDAVLDVAGARYEWIGRMVRAAVRRPRLGQVSFTDRFDRIATHPGWGLAFLLGVFGLVFWLTFSVAGPVQGWLEEGVITPLSAMVSAALAGAPAWLSGMLVDGMLAGAGVVVTFVPILFVFFLALGLLEDTGYQSRMAYVMDRFMHRLGLHGKSFLPLFLGFGCNVPAVMGSRVIESRPARLLTIMLTPFVPCSARLVVLAFLVPLFFPAFPALVAWGLVVGNLVVLVLIGLLLDRFAFRRERLAFVMEMPLYHVPNPRTILVFALTNVWTFLKRAATIIVIASMIIWVLVSYPGEHVNDSYLAMFGKMLEPVGGLMGLDWRLVVATLSGFVAKENSIAALGIIFGAEADSLGGTLSALIAPASALAFLVLNMLFVPCVATVAAIRQETESWGWTAVSAALMLSSAVIFATLVYQAAVLLGLGGALA
ncbi:MAG TPA: ferrous iron transport protein B [Gammaproteobacteria bacterium]|nr:ferrous iron transport protein B [Gammaproteobacteria bacterium]